MKLLLCLSGLLLITSCSKTSEFGVKDDLSLNRDGVSFGGNDIPAIPHEPAIPGAPATDPVDSGDPVEDPTKNPIKVSPPPIIVDVPETQPGEPTPPIVETPVTPPVIAPPKIKPEPNVDYPAIGSDESAQSCKYTFNATHVADGVSVTILSGSLNKLSKISDYAYTKLSPEDKMFVTDALSSKLSLQAVTGINSSIQDSSDKFLVENAQNASVSVTNIKNEIKVNYALKGDTTSIKATAVAMNTKVIAVLDGKTSSVDFTSLGKGAQVFLVYITQGDNVTCIKTTGVAGSMHSYVYGDDDKIAQSQMNATAIKGSSIIQYVSGKHNTKAFLTGTSISESKVNIKVDGLGNNTGSINDFTSMGQSNEFDIKIKGQDQTLLSLHGTSAGKNTKVNFDQIGQNNSKADLKFTAEENIQINGAMTGNAPIVNVSNNLIISKAAKVRVLTNGTRGVLTKSKS